jgi:hypothetical protein
MRSDADTILYDAFGIPHESQHSIGEVLKWLDHGRLDYMGAFGPVTLKDTLFALRQPEYDRFQQSLEAFPLSLQVSRLLRATTGFIDDGLSTQRDAFKPPSAFSRGLTQFGWFLLGFRFSIFSLAGRKAA